MMKRIILSTVLMTLGFLATVVVYLQVKQFVWSERATADNSFTNQQLIFAIIAEGLRAYLTTWLYIHHSTDKTRAINAVKFGLICSALIGSIWLILGIQFFPTADQLTFLIDDGIILGLQGVVTGVVLWYTFNGELDKGE